MRASMCADGTTCRLRYSPVVTTHLCGTERIVGDPHSVVAGVETTVVTATRGDEYHLTRLCGPELLNDFVEQGNPGNMYIDFPFQSCDKASIASPLGSGTGDMNWGRCVLWTVANMSTTRVPHNLNIRFTTSDWRLHSVMMGYNIGIVCSDQNMMALNTVTQ